LDMFRKDLGSFVRFYEFISQIVALDDPDLEKLAVYARHLRPLLREELINEPIDLSGIELTHYRLKKQAEHRLNLREGEGEYRLSGEIETGSGTGHDPDKESLAKIIQRLNELFAGEGLTDKDKLHYLHAIKGKVLQNEAVVSQLENNTPDQVMLGDFPTAVKDAIMESLDGHTSMASQLLRSKDDTRMFAELLLALLIQERSSGKDNTINR